MIGGYSSIVRTFTQYQQNKVLDMLRVLNVRETNNSDIVQISGGSDTIVTTLDTLKSFGHKQSSVDFRLERSFMQTIFSLAPRKLSCTSVSTYVHYDPKTGFPVLTTLRLYKLR